MMTTGSIRRLIAVMTMTAAVTASAHAQGDPQRTFDPAAAAIRKHGTTVRIDLIGDSTQTDHAGYGRGFCANLTAKVDCINMARGGASTRSFRAQGIWDRALQTKPDYMLIQFGHNDVVFNGPAGAGQLAAPNDAPAAAGANGAAAAPAFGSVHAGAKSRRLRTGRPATVRHRRASRRHNGHHGDAHQAAVLRGQRQAPLRPDRAAGETMRRVAAEMQVPLIEMQNERIARTSMAVGEEPGPSSRSPRRTDSTTIYDERTSPGQAATCFGRLVADD